MAYDADFFDLYRIYLKEPVVRTNHDHAFKLMALIIRGQPRVIDLGCGISEYSAYDVYHMAYVGIDLKQRSEVPDFIAGDYMQFDFTQELPFIPNAFVSLFSVECCHPAADKYALYEKLFSTLPQLQCGLVGGFFYRSKRDQKTVSEAGGIVSFQTIEDPSLHISKTFIELRIHMDTPSRMFGADVVEVWKLLIRI